MTLTYDEFLREKVRFDRSFGFEPGEVNPLLKGHQADIVRWAVRGGRRAIFAAFGLGKSVMHLEAAERSVNLPSLFDFTEEISA